AAGPGAWPRRRSRPAREPPDDQGTSVQSLGTGIFFVISSAVVFRSLMVRSFSFVGSGDHGLSAYRDRPTIPDRRAKARVERAPWDRVVTSALWRGGRKKGKGRRTSAPLCLWPSSSSAPGNHRLSSIARKNLAAASEQKHLCRIHDIRRATERLGQGRSVGA